jgi:hypothetical protein
MSRFFQLSVFHKAISLKPPQIHSLKQFRVLLRIREDVREYGLIHVLCCLARDKQKKKTVGKYLRYDGEDSRFCSMPHALC